MKRFFSDPVRRTSKKDSPAKLARRTKRRWRVVLLRAKGEILGQVEATDRRPSSRRCTSVTSRCCKRPSSTVQTISWYLPKSLFDVSGTIRACRRSPRRDINLGLLAKVKIVRQVIERDLDPALLVHSVGLAVQFG